MLSHVDNFEHSYRSKYTAHSIDYPLSSDTEDAQTLDVHHREHSIICIVPQKLVASTAVN